MKNNQKLAQKVYKILQDKCENDFTSYEDWCLYLDKFQIKVKDYDSSTDAADDLIGMLNAGNFNDIICGEPYSSIYDMGGFQFLIVSKDLAEKIAALNGIP